MSAIASPVAGDDPAPPQLPWVTQGQVRAYETAHACATRLLGWGGAPLKDALIRWVGRGLYSFQRRRRAVALRNLALAYGAALPPAARRKIARASFEHFGRLGLDVLFCQHYWPPAAVRDRVRVVGEAGLREVFARGRGCLGVSGHLGNWELMCMASAARGYPFTGIYRPPHGHVARHVIHTLRREYGLRLLAVPARPRAHDGRRLQRPSLRPAVKRLWDANEGVCFLCDQYPGEGHLEFDFLGVPDSPTATGLLRYALEDLRPILLTDTTYSDAGVTWHMEAPIYPTLRPGGFEPTVRYYGALINEWLSARIRQHPGQWTWAHRRFRRAHYERGRGARPSRPTRSDPPVRV